MKNLALALGLTLVVALAGCGGGGGGSGSPAAGPAEPGPAGARLEILEIAPASLQLAAGTERTLTATAIFSDQSKSDVSPQVFWQSTNSEIADFSAGTPNTLRAKAAGTTEIHAELDGLVATNTLLVTPATATTLAIEPPSAKVNVGDQLALSVFATFSDNSVQNVSQSATWASSEPAFASLDDQGRLTALAPGSLNVQASFAGLSATAPVTVAPAHLTGLEISPPLATAAKGLSFNVSATGLYSDQTKRDLTPSVTWASSDPSVATVSAAGRVKTLAEGVTAITATSAGISVAADLTVTPATLQKLEISPPVASLPAGRSQRFSATGIYSDQSTRDLTEDAVWSLDGSVPAQISNTAGSAGVVHSQAAGSGQVVATLAGIEARAALTVTGAILQGIEISADARQIPAGTSERLMATGLYSDGRSRPLDEPVLWTSSHPQIAMIENGASAGRVNGLTPGEATLSATVGSISASYTLQVTPAALMTIEIAPPQLDLPLGATGRFEAVGLYTDQSKRDLTTLATWSLASPQVGKIGNGAQDSGLLYSQAQGASAVQATFEGLTATATANVTAARLEQVFISPTARTLARGTRLQFTATGVYSDQSTRDLTTEVLWQSSVETVAAIGNEAASRGLLTARSEGSTTISATLDDTTVATDIQVSPAQLQAIEIVLDPPTLVSGAAGRAQATGVYSDGGRQDLTAEVLWSSTNPAVVTVSNATDKWGSVQAMSAGTAQIAATLQGVQGTATIEVSPATLQSLSISPDLPDLAGGLSVQLTATAHYSDGTSRDVTAEALWRSSNPSAAGIINLPRMAGAVHTYSAGQTTISAEFSNLVAEQVLTVTGAELTGLRLSAASLGVVTGDSVTFSLVGDYSDGSSLDLTDQVIWLSSDESIATVGNGASDKGRVSGVRAGEVFIAGLVSRVAVVIRMTVLEPFASLAITPLAPEIPRGAALQLAAQATFGDGSSADVTSLVAWQSSAPSVALVNLFGQALALNEGTAQLTASLGGVVSNAATLTVAPAQVLAIGVSGTQVAGGIQFNAEALLSDGQTVDFTSQVVWSAAPAGILDFSGSGAGFAVPLAPGSCTVTATDEDTGVSGQLQVTLQ